MPAERFLYLTTIGRVSGLPRTIEIWFVEREGHYYIVAERREAAQWVRNLGQNPSVRFHVRTRDDPAEDRDATATATARAVREPGLVAEVASLMAAKYGWSDGLVVEIVPRPASPR
jgi:deazaflavin-dependent oxidoreductase (nitroreductase family)